MKERIERSKIDETRKVVGNLLKQATSVQLPEIELPRKASEAQAIELFADWTAKVRRSAQLAKALTAILDKVGGTLLSDVNRSIERLDLYAEARGLLKKPDSSFARKAYEGGRIALAVREGFKDDDGE